jgi:hypothetical protein
MKFLSEIARSYPGFLLSKIIFKKNSIRETNNMGHSYHFFTHEKTIEGHMSTSHHTMKLLFTLILIIFYNYSHSQTASNTVSYNDKNIYYQALTQYINFEQRDHGLTLDTLFIEDDYRLTDSIILQSAQTVFIKLKAEDISNYLTTRKGFVLYKVVPLRYENGEFSVSFVPVFVSQEKKKRNTHAVISGSYRIVYKFDNNKFIFQRVENNII